MIIVLGSINADLVFALDRLPTRGETVLTEGSALFPGGKGANQAAAAAKSGAETMFLGCVGRDAFGPAMKEFLAESGCDVSGICAVSRPTGTAAVMVEKSGENQIVVASGANLAVTADMLPADRLGPGTTLVCQMEIPPAETEAAIARAKATGCRTVLNLAPAIPVSRETLDAVDVLVVNEGEARVLRPDGGSLEDIARGLAADHQLDCVVTLGGAGAVAVRADGSGGRVPGLAIEPVDTVGAGDAFVGVLAATLDAGADLMTALARATVAGGLACTKEGAMSGHPTGAEIEARLADLPPASPL